MTVVGPLTVMGLLTIGAVVGVWFLRREWIQFVVAATAVFPQTAALIFGDNGFPLFYLAVVLIALLSAPYLLFAIARPGGVPALTARRWGWPDLIAIVLLVWAGIITILGPRVFAGMGVFAPELGIGAIDTVPLEAGLGNIAQLGYLSIAVMFLLLAGRLLPIDRRMLGAVVWLAVGLATLRLVTESSWPHELLQNMPGFNYATPERLSGTLHEPSVLGMYLVAAAAYFACRLRVRGTARVGATVGLGLVGVDFIANNSGTALLGLALVAALGVAVGAWRIVATSRFTVGPWLIAIAVIVTGAALTQLPLIYSMTVGYAADKAGSASFSERSGSNARSWEILVESFGAGIGLGSNRPSSLFFLVLSCLGLIGITLLATLVVLALRRAGRIPGAVPAAWTLVAVDRKSVV